MPKKATTKFRTRASELAAAANHITSAAPNETTLVNRLEHALEKACLALGVPYSAYSLGRTLRRPGASARFMDIIHGAVVIEYEAPDSFHGSDNSRLRQAKRQAQEYAELLSTEEGRDLPEYVMVAWDGLHIAFGRFPTEDGEPTWDALRPFNALAAETLLRHLASDGIPLVHPKLLSSIAGPESDFGSELIPRFFDAVRKATQRSTTTKTRLLFTEWRRLFGQVVGVQTARLQKLLRQQADLHNRPYQDDSAAYLFALNTYIALVAKLVAALSLPQVSENVSDNSVPIKDRINTLESGELFDAAGIVNVLISDFFSWYSDDPDWSRFSKTIEALIEQLAQISYDVTRKKPASTRDLFKGIYEEFVPGALRHALGEFYTPDWLAAHALDVAGWKSKDGLIDPTCGTGTFILEALRRRLEDPAYKRKDAHELLRSLYGLDLNPLATLAARASLVVFLSPRLNPERPLHLPIFLADAINPPVAKDQMYEHRLQTELGVKLFLIPRAVIENPRFFEIFQRLRELINSDYQASEVAEIIFAEYDLNLVSSQAQALRDTIDTLVELHENDWDGIWCSILAERFFVGAIPPSKFVAGNPPWVKWSHLPPEYAQFIKPRCLALGVFSEDRWVGGIESDISTVITYEAIAKWVAKGGTLAFFITGTVFANESSQGFRRFRLDDPHVRCRPRIVEDFDEISPFDGVSNHPTLLILVRDKALRYPVPYKLWHATKLNNRVVRTFQSSRAFRRRSRNTLLLARPVPGTDAGPWLKGTPKEHRIWRKVFGAGGSNYRARKGITTDLNGLFFVQVLSGSRARAVARVRNNPAIGKTPLPRRTAELETKHLFPLLRGRGVRPFEATVDPDYRVILPQRGMHGDPKLHRTARKTWNFLKTFKKRLRNRSSYKRFQRGQPFWSVWSTGPYTFSKFKVLWREMSGRKFAAAYIGPQRDKILGTKIPIPDHKLYFIPCKTEREAAFLTAILNAPTVADAISKYAAQLSLGVSVVEYLKVPQFKSSNNLHRKIAELGTTFTKKPKTRSPSHFARLDRLVKQLFGIS